MTSATSRVVLTIDPGLHECGAALSHDGVVTACKVLMSKCPSRDPLVLGDALMQMVAREFGSADLLVVERPVYRATSKAGIRPVDLLNLSIVVGCFTMAASTVRSVTPMDWKGSMPKETHHARVERFLSGFQRASSDELKLWHSLSRKIDHNARDAFALNLFTTGRTRRGCE